MKKTLLPLTAAVALMLPSATLAADGGFQMNAFPGGFQGPTAAIDTDTVAKALKAWDGAPAVLTGTIVERLGGTENRYLFRDATGDIMTDIGPKEFFGQTVTPQNKVRLFGKVKKGMDKPVRIKVKRLEIIQ